MDIETARLIKESLVGHSNGQYCTIPINPAAYMLFERMATERGMSTAISDTNFCLLLKEIISAFEDQEASEKVASDE